MPHADFSPDRISGQTVHEALMGEKRTASSVEWQTTLASNIPSCLDKRITRMARQASIKPADSSAHLGLAVALCGSAFLQTEASPQIVRKAKDNRAGFDLANGRMFSIQSGDCPARPPVAMRSSSGQKQLIHSRP